MAFSKPGFLAFIGLNHAKLLKTVFLVFFFFISPQILRISADILRFQSFFGLIRLISPKFFVFLSRFSLNRPIFVEISYFGFH